MVVPALGSRRSDKKRSIFFFTCILIAGSCDRGGQDSGVIPQPPPPTPIPRPEPLETVVMDEMEVLPIEEAPVSGGSRLGIPCPWASVWEKPEAARPVPVGGMVKPPKKLREVPPVLPPRKTDIQGTPVLEVIIDTDGTVAEATILQSFDPSWPEADTALIQAIRQWKYEPSVLDGDPVPICMKITLSIDWNGVRKPAPDENRGGSPSS